MKKEIATFALGCFWEPDDFFSKLPGVIETTVGYSGGIKKNPTYHDLGDHSETVAITFDPQKISYAELLKHFFKKHNPTLMKPRQYRSIIFYQNNEQRKEAEKAMKDWEKSSGKVALTAFEEASTFYPAEEYHQKYYQKNNVNSVC